MMTNKEYIQKLLDSYMVAETTKEEEELLSDYFCSHQDIPAEWQNFSVMFRGLRQAKTRIVAFHKRTFLKWSVVTAVAASVILLLVFRFSQEPVEEQPVEANTVEQSIPQPVPQPIVEKKGEEVLAEVQPMTKPVSKSRSVPKAVEQKDTPASASPADSFDYYLAHLEAEMEALDDSVSTAHLEKLISADARLQQLVNRIVGKQTEQVMNELRKDSTANYITF